MGEAKTDDRWYVSAAVIVDTEKVESISHALDDISNGFNSGAPLKSKKIKVDHVRRFQLLERMLNLDYRYVALVVDKSKLTEAQGLHFKSSYYKNINRHFYDALGDVTSGTINVVVDTYGYGEFQASCVKYFNERSDLFNSKRAVFEYCADENNRLIQLADIIAGTLRYYFSLGDRAYCSKVRDLLRTPKEARIDVFPPEYDNPSIGSNEGTERDNDIRRAVLNKAAEFIRQHDDIDEDVLVRCQVEVLKRLMDAVSLDAGSIYSEALRESVNRTLAKPISKEQFASDVIGRLRFAGIVIAGSHSGYRLAVKESDVEAYLRLNKTVIEPMLAKMSVARSFFQSELGLDILENDNTRCLKAILATFDQVRTDRAIDFQDESELESDL